MGVTETFETPDGKEVWYRVHPAAACAGRHCVIHNPSEHGMRDWPMHLRETGLVERICEHGVGHPDPDSAAYMDRRLNHKMETWSVHGCDGCCYFPKGDE